MADNLLQSGLLWLQDPRRTQQLQQVGGLLSGGISNLQKSKAEYDALQAMAFADPRNPLKITDQNAFNRLAEMAQSGPLSFAPLGMTERIPERVISDAGDAISGLFGTPAVELAKKNITKRDVTVMNPQRIAYPDIYQDPRILVKEAASRVAPESPLLKQLFGVTRQDLFDIAQQGTRKGNILDIPFKAAANAQGAAHAEQVMNPRNVARIQSMIEEARKYPDLYQGMGAWYTMDPLYQEFVKVLGKDRALGEYMKFNTLTGMSSPGSEVLTELNRGSAANMMDAAGRFNDFVKYGGLADWKRGKDFPPELAAVIGHPYHSTAQAGPMGKYLESGQLEMGSAKVPSYIHASGVPESGFQTEWPVGDAHWSRLVGLPDVRGATTKKGVESIPNASASVPEMVSLGPWWKNKIAGPMGLEAVPAQAIVWGAGSGATGVTSPIGAPKLELLAQQIGKAANRMGVSPQVAKEMIIRGEAHAGFIDPAVAALMASTLGSGVAVNKYANERPLVDNTPTNPFYQDPFGNPFAETIR